MGFSTLLSPPVRQRPEISEIWILRDPSLVIHPESIQIRFNPIRLPIRGGLDCVPSKRIFQRTLTDIIDTEYIGVGNVRNDALMLRAVSGYTVKFCFGNFQLAPVQGH